MNTPEIDSGSDTDYCESSPDLLNPYGEIAKDNPPDSDSETSIVDNCRSEEYNDPVLNKTPWDTLTAFSQFDGFADSFLLNVEGIREYTPTNNTTETSNITTLDDTNQLTVMDAPSTCEEIKTIERDDPNEGNTSILPKEKNTMSEAEHMKILHEKLPKIQSAFSLYNTYDKAEMKVILRNGNIKFNGKDDKSILANRMLECLQEGKLFKASLKQGLSVLPRLGTAQGSTQSRPNTPSTLLTKKRKHDSSKEQTKKSIIKSLSMNSITQAPQFANNISSTTPVPLTTSGISNPNLLHKPVPNTQNSTKDNKSEQDACAKQGIITMFNPSDYKKSTISQQEITGDFTSKLKTEHENTGGISVMNQSDHMDSQLWKPCEAGLSSILNKYTLRDPNSYYLQKSLENSNTPLNKGSCLFPHIQLPSSINSISNDMDSIKSTKELTDISLLQSALNSFKSRLLQHHFQFPPTSSLRGGSSKSSIPIEPSLTALKSINFRFQKLGICLNQVTRLNGSVALVIQSINRTVTTCEKSHKLIVKLLCVGDELVTVNGCPIHDIFDNVSTHGQNDALLQIVGKLISELPRPINIGFISSVDS